MFTRESAVRFVKQMIAYGEVRFLLVCALMIAIVPDHAGAADRLSLLMVYVGTALAYKLRARRARRIARESRAS